ncbi:MAG: hypothetical protein KKH98_15745 [Spirochaetes bacterium]|nr:hypothetical protein [Spirochaetota bacterium]
MLKQVLKENKDFYVQSRKVILKELRSLPKGSIKKRKIHNKYYYYLQYRKKLKVIHEYLGKKKPLELEKKIKRRKLLENQFKKIDKNIKILEKLKYD